GLTIDYVKERKAFGKRILDFQNTQFELADMKTQATMAKVFYEYCVGLHIEGKCDTAMASMAKYKLSDLQNT
ncbi:acyl-CoA dehydrogenase family protein, partial [Serratia marcescens]